MITGIKEILLISTPKDIIRFKDLLGNGNHIGLKISYAVQDEPKGIAEAFIIGKEFIKNDNVCLILGDNLFHGKNLELLLASARKILQNDNKSSIFGYHVNNPQDFGIIQFNSQGSILKIIEKPKNPKSDLAVVGLYFYTNDVVEIVKKIKPSLRNELEITDINNYYLQINRLNVIKLKKDFSWLDTGTFDALIKASEYIKNVENKTGIKVACLEEIAFELGLINSNQLNDIGISMGQSSYGQYLINKLKNI